MDMTSGTIHSEPAVSPGHAEIPRADWDRAPWNRHTFLHVSEMTPTARIWRGRRPARDFPEARRDIGAIAYSLDGESNTVGALFAAMETDGVIVLSGGQLVAEQYFGSMRRETLHLSQSLAKSVTGTVAGILAARGVIAVDQKLADLLPALKDTGYAEATFRHVLDMASGVTFNEDYTALDSHMAMMDHACGWKDPSAPDWPHAMWDLILSLKEVERPHGSAFHYRSIESDVLAFALQAATGKSIATLMSEEIWQKIGAEEDASITVDRKGYGLACGGFNATLRDYARFAQLYAHGGKIDGEQILPAAWIVDTLKGDGSIFAAENRHVLPEGAYRNQFWLERAGGSIIIGRGVFGQTIWIDTATDFVCVVLSTWPDFVNPARTRAVFAAIRAIQAAVGA